MRKELELEQGTPAWHAKRLTGIGGTEAAAIMGASFAGKLRPDRIWDEKVGNVSADSTENEYMKQGKRLEGPARELYEALYGWSTPPLNVLHDDYDYVRASLDGIRRDDKLIVEIKCCQPTNHAKLLKLQDIQDPMERQLTLAHYFNYYRYQMLYQLLITGADVCHFVGYNETFADHKKIAVVEVFPEPVEQARLLERVIEFWQFVVDREPPSAEWCLPTHRLPTELKLPSGKVEKVAEVTSA